MSQVVLINGSPRGNGSNTRFALKVMQDVLLQENVGAALIDLRQKNISHCNGCLSCHNKPCFIRDDMDDIIPLLLDADAMVLGSPVYYGGVTGLLKNFIDRCDPLRYQWQMRDKLGAALVVAGSRNGGQEYTIQSIHAFFLLMGMVVIGPCGEKTAGFGATGLAYKLHKMQQDEEGIQSAKDLALRIAGYLKRYRQKSIVLEV